jgi:hypothetical protein
MILWHIDTLLGNNCETNNETMAIVRQQLHKYAPVLELLLDSGPHATLKIPLEAVFCISLLQGYIY